MACCSSPPCNVDDYVDEILKQCPQVERGRRDNGVLLFSAVNVNDYVDEVLKQCPQVERGRQFRVRPMACCSSPPCNVNDYVDEVLKQCPQVERGRCQWRVALLRRAT